jgi:hypothetical protein
MCEHNLPPNFRFGLLPHPQDNRLLYGTSQFLAGEKKLAKLADGPTLYEVASTGYLFCSAGQPAIAVTVTDSYTFRLKISPANK